MNREMINSGIEWIGSVPKSWKLERLQWHLEEVKESNDPIKTTQVLSLTNKLGVIPYEEKGEQGNKSKENLSEYKLAYPETIVANSMNILIGSVGLSNYFGCVSPVYYVYKGKENSNIEFYNFLFQTREFQKELRRYANGILEIRLRVSSNNILKRYVPIPSKEEQEKIVLLLKEKIARIDELIANQEKQISVLKEYKKTKITEILKTNNNQGGRLKFYLSEQMMYGANESGYAYKEGYVRYIRITDITSDGELKNNEDNQYLPLEKAEPFLLEEGDILFARSGGTVGKSFIYKSKEESSAFAGYLIKAKCDKTKLLPEYLYFYTQSSEYDAWKNMIFIQATIQNIGANKYSNMPICVPSVEKQNVIIAEIVQLNKKFDELIKIKQQKIEKLNEYKKSLIYEYVTGKREVKEG